METANSPLPTTWIGLIALSLMVLVAGSGGIKLLSWFTRARRMDRVDVQDRAAMSTFETMQRSIKRLELELNGALARVSSTEQMLQSVQAQLSTALASASAAESRASSAERRAVEAEQRARVAESRAHHAERAEEGMRQERRVMLRNQAEYLTRQAYLESLIQNAGIVVRPWTPPNTDFDLPELAELVDDDQAALPLGDPTP